MDLDGLGSPRMDSDCLGSLQLFLDCHLQHLHLGLRLKRIFKLSIFLKKKPNVTYCTGPNLSCLTQQNYCKILKAKKTTKTYNKDFDDSGYFLSRKNYSGYHLMWSLIILSFEKCYERTKWKFLSDPKIITINELLNTSN
jgi:hypothetical protein